MVDLMLVRILNEHLCFWALTLLNEILHCFVLYCIVLYCIVLYCIVLYCIVLRANISFKSTPKVFVSNNRPLALVNINMV